MMRSIVQTTGVVLLVITLGLVAACAAEPTVAPGPLPSSVLSPSTEPPTPTEVVQRPAASPTRPSVGGSIRVGGVGSATREITNLPPFLSAALYDTLLSVDPADGSLKPGLSDSWQVSEDGLTLTFHLRDGLRWQDGQTLTASDAAWTISTLASKSARLLPAADFGPTASAVAPDPRTLTVKLKQAYCPALTGIGTLRILPRHVLEGRDLSSLTDEALMGSGPLLLRSWVGNTITLVRNPNYWQTPVLVSDWTYTIFSNQDEAIAAARAGQVDLLDFGVGTRKTIEDIAGGTIISYPASRTYSLAMNLENKVLADVQVRRAIAGALDKSALADQTFGGDAQVLAGTLLPSHWAAPQAATDPFDPNASRGLLAAAGWADADKDGVLEKNGARLQLSLWAEGDGAASETLAYATGAMLRKVGIAPILQLDDRVGLLTRTLMHQYDLAIVSENIPLDPDQHYYWSSDEATKSEGLNISSYSSPGADALLSQGQAAPRCDPALRRQAYSELDMLLASDLPQVPLFSPPDRVYLSNRVGGPRPGTFAGSFWNLYDWYMK